MHKKKIAVAHFRFFEAEVRNKFGSTGKLLSSALRLQKNVTLLPPRKTFTTNSFSGWSGPATLAKKVLALGRAVENTFFIAVACALAGTSGTERWPTHFITCTKLFIEARERWRAAILHNVLM